MTAYWDKSRKYLSVWGPQDQRPCWLGSATNTLPSFLVIPGQFEGQVLVRAQIRYSPQFKVMTMAEFEFMIEDWRAGPEAAAEKWWGEPAPITESRSRAGPRTSPSQEIFQPPTDIDF